MPGLSEYGDTGNLAGGCVLNHPPNSKTYDSEAKNLSQGMSKESLSPVTMLVE